jgi:hypothetical protein
MHIKSTTTDCGESRQQADPETDLPHCQPIELVREVDRLRVLVGLLQLELTTIRDQFRLFPCKLCRIGDCRDLVGG